MRQYLVELHEQNPTEEPVPPQEQVLTTDPDCSYDKKVGIFIAPQEASWGSRRRMILPERVLGS